MLTMTMHVRGRSFQPSPYPKQNLAAFRALADAVHEAGGKIFGEPWYFWGAVGQWQPLSHSGPGARTVRRAIQRLREALPHAKCPSARSGRCSMHSASPRLICARRDSMG